MAKKLNELLERLLIMLKKFQTNTGSETLLKKELIYFGKSKKKKKGNGDQKMASKVIPFPNAKVSEKVKQSMQLELKKNRVERDINLVMQQDSWDLYTFSADELEMLSLFGETMKFDSKVASRVITKLAEFISRMTNELLEEPY